MDTLNLYLRQPPCHHRRPPPPATQLPYAAYPYKPFISFVCSPSIPNPSFFFFPSSLSILHFLIISPPLTQHLLLTFFPFFFPFIHFVHHSYTHREVLAGPVMFYLYRLRLFLFLVLASALKRSQLICLLALFSSSLSYTLPSRPYTSTGLDLTTSFFFSFSSSLYPIVSFICLTIRSRFDPSWSCGFLTCCVICYLSIYQISHLPPHLRIYLYYLLIF